MKLHHKGYVLVQLEREEVQWDKPLIDAAMTEYKLNGDYWVKHFSIIMDELASAGLISREDHRLDTLSDRLMFKYRLTDFGRERMQDTGLL
ncbi:hypothetical protein [Methylophaga sp.]|uniref:hypothetical protein n=1 Tax=Methylophaga sp. TaxID=2024840 RepID=UPI003F69CF8A